MKTPTIAEVQNAAKKYEENAKCKDCIVSRECAGGLHYENCKTMFLSAVVAGKLNLDGTPVHGEKPEPAKPTLPKWCKVGAWVLNSKNKLPGVGPLGKILDIKDDGNVILKEIGHYGDLPTSSTVDSLQPIRFRLPTREEAYALLGKVMAFKDGRCELVYLVDEDGVNGDDMGTERMLFINGHPAECLQLCTIDGVPFGVPEVDEDAEAQK